MIPELGHFALTIALALSIAQAALAFTGAAKDQAAAVIEKVDALVAEHPDAATYTPGAIL